MSESGVLSVKEAAFKVGASEKTIRRMLSEGKLEGAFQLRDNGNWKIPADALKQKKGGA